MQSVIDYITAKQVDRLGHDFKIKLDAVKQSLTGCRLPNFIRFFIGLLIDEMIAGFMIVVLRALKILEWFKSVASFPNGKVLGTRPSC